MEWTGSDFRYEYTYQHWIFLRLPSPLQQGMSYTVTVSSATNATPISRSVTFDIYNSRSEAVHVNLVGYVAATDHKAADLSTRGSATAAPATTPLSRATRSTSTTWAPTR